MQYIANASEAKKIDGISIQKMGIPSLVLMERASLCVAEYIDKHASKRMDTVLIVCGIGNNGGDGVAVGRILFSMGYDVTIHVVGREAKASEELRTQLQIARNLEMNFSENVVYSEYSVIVDALFGIGLSREITGIYREAIDQINQTGAMVVAVDIPSGIDATSGKILGTAIKADATVTFGVNKLGLVLFPGMQYAGKVTVVDIGFPKKALQMTAPAVISYDREDIAALFPKRKPHSNKGTYGKTLIIAGSKEMGGAAFFAAKAAYLMGSGLVKVVTHENNRVMLQSKLPEVLIQTYSEEMVSLEEEILWASAIVCGPGLGTSEISKELVYNILKVKDIPVLLDADALNHFSEMESHLTDNKTLNLGENFVVTPHLKEMSRLLNHDSVKEIQADIIACAKKSTNAATVVLKDARTVVTDYKKTYINLSGNNALAKGGSGDVLSGMIGGLLARGVSNFEAATLGVYLHGLTAEEYVKEESSSSMLASDILKMLSNVLP